MTMKGVIQQTRHTLAVMTLALASCSGAMRAPTATPEVIPLYFAADSSTSALLTDLSDAYRQDTSLSAVIEQPRAVQQMEDFFRPSELPPQHPVYAITTFMPGDQSLWAAPLGYEGIAIISHPGTVPDRLTASELRQIFSGSVTNWQAFTGVSQEITVVSRESGSAIQQAFNTLVMGQRQTTQSARLATTSGAMLDIVASTPGSIGIAAFSEPLRSVNVVPIAETDSSTPLRPNRENIASGVYPLQTPVLIVGLSPPVPGDGYYEFILWAQQGEGREIVSLYYAPLALSG